MSQKKSIQAIKNKYGDSTSFLKTFNPDLQNKYAKLEKRCFEGEAPTLTYIRLTYGEGVAVSWVAIQLSNLSEHAGCKEKITMRQIEDMSLAIIDEYHYLKVTELMVFFQKFKRGHFGKFYGAVDPIVIMQALIDFTFGYRSQKKEQYLKAQEESERNERYEAYKKMNEHRKFVNYMKYTFLNFTRFQNKR